MRIIFIEKCSCDARQFLPYLDFAFLLVTHVTRVTLVTKCNAFLSRNVANLKTLFQR